MTTTLEDKEAIRDLMAAYCVCLDHGRAADFAALFTADGVWETAFGTGQGRANIQALAARISPAPEGAPRQVHMVSNIVIRLAGDRATVTSNWIAVANTAGGPLVQSGGAYVDELVRDGGTWLFAHRQIQRYIAKKVS